MQNDSDFHKLLMLEMDKEESYENNYLITNEPLEKNSMNEIYSILSLFIKLGTPSL